MPRDELGALPLQFRAIWEKELLSQESLHAMTVDNTSLHSRHMAHGSAKPISKIVQPEDD